MCCWSQEHRLGELFDELEHHTWRLFARGLRNLDKIMVGSCIAFAAALAIVDALVLKCVLAMEIASAIVPLVLPANRIGQTLRSNQKSRRRQRLAATKQTVNSSCGTYACYDGTCDGG